MRTGPLGSSNLAYANRSREARATYRATIGGAGRAAGSVFRESRSAVASR